MEIRIEQVGPEEAHELLTYNTHNRHLRPAHRSKLAGDMRNGMWRDGGMLLFAGSGTERVLLDGQHRLHAVIEAETKIDFIIVEGLSLDDQQAIDTGIRRSLADVLKWRGEQNCTDLAAALNWQWRYSNDAMRSNHTPTIAEALAVYSDHPGLSDSFRPTRHAAKVLGLSRGLCACLCYQQQAIDENDALAFWNMLDTGLFPSQNERYALHVLRRTLEDNSRKATRKLDVVAVAALLIKGWNAWREGKEVTLLTWRRGGATPEPFPLMDGDEDPDA